MGETRILQTATNYRRLILINYTNPEGGSACFVLPVSYQRCVVQERIDRKCISSRREFSIYVLSYYDVGGIMLAVHAVNCAQGILEDELSRIRSYLLRPYSSWISCITRCVSLINLTFIYVNKRAG